LIRTVQAQQITQFLILQKRKIKKTKKYKRKTKIKNHIKVDSKIIKTNFVLHHFFFISITK